MSKKPFKKPVTVAPVGTAQPVPHKPETIPASVAAKPATVAPEHKVETVAAPAVAVEAPAAANAPVPVFELPKVIADVQAQVQDVTSKSLADVKSGFEKAKTETVAINSAVESSASMFSKGFAELNAKVLGAFRSNTEATLDLFKAAFAAKTPSELVELQMAHARKQLEVFSVQAKDFSSAASKIAEDATKPLKAKIEKALAA